MKSLWVENNIWNNWSFQLHWNNMEWVDPRIHNRKTNPLCTITYNFYIIDNNETSQFFGHSNMNPIE